MSDPRLKSLSHWVSAQFDGDNLKLEPASSDASFRRYFRVQPEPEKTLIVMDAPPEHEDNPAFVKVAALLEQASIHAPKVLAKNMEQGFLLLTDLGTTTYLAADQSDAAGSDVRYQAAVHALLKMQQNCSAQTLPSYDAKLLDFEMALFRDWLLLKHLGLKLSNVEEEILAQQFSFLRESALQQPQVFVHRDYHSRNLMDCGADSPGILDFQDAVKGPVTYDLVSLLRDCYRRWPDAQVNAWFDLWYNGATDLGLLNDASRAQVRQWFDWMGVQRHIKASGIFARLNHRDGKSNYLNDIPLTVSYIREIAGRYEALQPMLPILDRTPW